MTCEDLMSRAMMGDFQIVSSKRLVGALVQTLSIQPHKPPQRLQYISSI